jgi:cell division septation protein DedD
MSNSQCATEPELADPSLVQSASVQSVPEATPRLLKGLLIAFAGTVTIGLALASWYVGVRIVAANEAGPVSAAVNSPVKVSTIQPAPGLPAPPPAAPSAPATPSAQEDAMAKAFWYTVPPPPPELYLQVAGLGQRQDASFVKELEARGYRARIVIQSARSATNQEETRILIGPFVGRSSLEKAERRLRSAGVLAMEAPH